MKYIVKTQMTLMDFLMIHYARKQVKLYFKFKQVYVNGSSNTQFDHMLKIGDIVEISKEQKTESSLDILYEDSECIVINKPSGLLSVSGGGEKEKTAYHLVGEYLKQKDKSAKVFIVHRLDRDTSGILMFAKNEKIKNLYQDRWNDLAMKRGYIAVVEGKLVQKQGTIKNYLDESKTQQVYITKSGGKLAITDYQVLKESKQYSLVEVSLKTGRKNQIRVHMQSIGHSIVNDKKYGSSSNPIKRLGLHCHVFVIKHPITDKEMLFEAPVPSSFESIFK